MTAEPWSDERSHKVKSAATIRMAASGGRREAMCVWGITCGDALDLLATLDARDAEIARLREALHQHRCHPDYEYATTTNGRKDGTDPWPEGEGWERNVYGDDGHSCWERFDYHEENYFRRKKPESDA